MRVLSAARIVRPLTRTCEGLPSEPAATPERDEALSVASLLSLIAVVRSAGAPRSLLYARVNFDRLQGVSTSPIGALPPRTARATYTRDARRAQRQRQLARRSGVAGLARALA